MHMGLCCYRPWALLTHLRISETDNGQPVFPIGQAGSRGAEDGKYPPHH